MDIEHKVAADENQEDIDVWDQEMQSRTYVYETIIETLEYQMGKIKTRKHRKVKARGWIDNKTKGSKGVGNSWTIKEKLPKLVITMFNGIHVNWIRF